MSLAIEVDDVTEVLLADGWHTVLDASFLLDAYEYMWGDDLLHGGGSGGICATGFSFKEKTLLAITVVEGPLTAIMAIRRLSRDPDATGA